MGISLSTASEGPASSASPAIDDVLFDFCGVLVEWHPERALEGLYPPERLDEFFAGDDRSGFYYFDDMLDGGVPFDQVLEAYARERPAETVEMFRAYHEHSGRGLVGMMPGMEELVADLKAQGVGVWGLTNWAAHTFEAAFGKFPLIMEGLDGVVVSGAEGMKKPDECIYRLALDRFGLDARRTVFFDDNSYNLMGAGALGMKVSEFCGAARARETLRSLGVAL